MSKFFRFTAFGILFLASDGFLGDIRSCHAFMALPTAGRMNVKVMLSSPFALMARRRNQKAENNKEDSASSEIPQLPSFGGSSFDPFAEHSTKAVQKQQSSPTAFVSGKFELQYTCKVCNTRNCHKVSRIAYNKGVVITICKGCESKHLISDNLGYTQQFDGNLEAYFAEKGLGENINRVSGDVFHLEKVLNVDSKSGSIVGENGELHLE